MATATLVFGTASTAVADVVTGEGGGTGWEYPGAVTLCTGGPPVAELAGTTFEISHFGTYSGVATAPPSTPVYVGPTDVTVTAGQHVISPLGTHGGGGCSGTFPIPAAVPITATVTSPPGTVGAVACTGSGTFLRVNTNIVIEFTGPCTVDGNLVPGHAGPTATTHVLTGTMTPCIFPIITYPLTGDPISNPECDLFEDPVPGGAGSHYMGAYVAAGGP